MNKKVKENGELNKLDDLHDLDKVTRSKMDENDNNFDLNGGNRDKDNSLNKD